MKRILFVDDESRVLDGIRRMLYAERDRWEMQFALGGEAALQACEAGSFDVVVSDMRMPGMDGATLLGLIRDRYPNTARIILSGHSEIALATRAVPVAHRFLSKPCDAANLLATIERVCALQELLCAPEIRTIVGKVGELPSLSVTYMSLTRTVSDPDAPVERVARIIEQDVAMSAKILQLVNSAFFGLAQKVNTLQSAVGYLGMDTIKNLALASEAFRAFVPNSRIPQSVCESMQRHAQSTALIAGALPVDPKSRDTVIVSALLHDIGSLILASVMPREFVSTRASAAENNCAVFLAEEQLLGTSHAEIGAYLLGLWGLPNLAVEAIANHHHPERAPHSGLDCTAAVYIANLLAHELEAHPLGSIGLPINETDRANLETLGFLSRFDEFRNLALESRE
jgi:HD-like signal output (HDOD) protein/CheY-like chemotaxis protein